MISYLLSLERPCRVFFAIGISAEESMFIKIKREIDE
jgi:hypothetical protein